MLDPSPVNRRRVARLGMTALLWATAVTAQSTTDLIQAVKTGRPDAVQTLLDHGADPNSPQGDGATALHHAAHRNDLEAARLLTEAGADVTAANELGATPLWLAARNGSAAMVSHLLMIGCLFGLWSVAALGNVFLAGVLAVTGLLAYEHWLVRPDDLDSVNIAFFQVNAIISLGLFLACS